MLHIDPIWFYRGWRGVGVRSSKMKVVAEWLGLDEQKMQVPADVWGAARHGDKAALDIVVDRCESDVNITMDIYMFGLNNKLRKGIQRYP